MTRSPRAADRDRRARTDPPGNRLFTKDFASSADEREAVGLRGLLPGRVMTIEEQVALELERWRRKDDPLEADVDAAMCWPAHVPYLRVPSGHP
jgi:hypothetical protein